MLITRKVLFYYVASGDFRSGYCPYEWPVGIEVATTTGRAVIVKNLS
jgi:hypothetical protein